MQVTKDGDNVTRDSKRYGDQMRVSPIDKRIYMNIAFTYGQNKEQQNIKSLVMFMNGSDRGLGNV